MPRLEDMLAGVSSGGQAAAGKAQQLVGPVLESITSQGGLRSVLSRMQDSSISTQVSSWINSGPNIPVTADQVMDAMRPETLQAIASKAGMSVQETAAGLAELLPTLVDRVTPGGKVPGTDELKSIVSSIPGLDRISATLLGSSSPDEAATATDAD